MTPAKRSTMARDVPTGRGPERKDKRDPDFGRRAEEIRAQYEMNMDDFAELLTDAGWLATKSEISRIERGMRSKAFAMLDAYASLDKERRGRLWMGWGITRDDLLGPPPKRR